MTGSEPNGIEPPHAVFLRRLWIIAAVAVLVTLAMLVTLAAPSVLMLTFGGILLGVLLRTLADWVGPWVHLGRTWSLTLVVLVLVGIVAGGIWFLGDRFSSEVDQLSEQLPKALVTLEAHLRNHHWGRWLLNEGQAAWAQYLSASSGSVSLVQRARGWLSAGAEAVTDLLVLLFAGLFFAANPELYVRGVLWLLPAPYRPRVRETFEAVTVTLRWWLLGQVAAMVFIGLVTAGALWLLGVPLAFVLAVIAALLNFVPNFGPVIATVPAALVAMTTGPMHAIWVIVIYIIIQQLQDHVLTPLIQQRATRLPPALLLLAQILVGLWSGVLGLAFAAPLTAAIMVVVKRLYVGTVVEGPGK